MTMIPKHKKEVRQTSSHVSHMLSAVVISILSVFHREEVVFADTHIHGSRRQADINVEKYASLADI